MLALTFALFLAAFPGGAAQAANDPAPLDALPNEVVLAWNLAAHDAAMTQDAYANGLAMVRIYTMMHAAQHDALRAIDPVYESYAFDGPSPAADPVAAAAAAAHGVLAATIPGQRAAFDQQLAHTLADVPHGDAKARGVALGEQAAAAILALRQDDGSDTPIDEGYVPGEGPERYQFTAAYEFAFMPGWRYLHPSALTSPDQFRSVPHPTLDSEVYARDFNEVISPAGFEDYFREMTEAWGDLDRMTQINQTYGLEMDLDSVPALCERFGLSFRAQ